MSLERLEKHVELVQGVLGERKGEGDGPGLRQERDELKGRVEGLEKVLRDLLPGVEQVTGRSVEAHLATGRWYLNVAGHVVVIEGQQCFDPCFGKRWTPEDIKTIEKEFNAPIRAVLDAGKETS